MSRIRTEVSTVQFQVDARKANASMQALQTKAEDLAKDIQDVNNQIAALGNVSPDHQGLINLRKQLRGLNNDMKDVQNTMRDYMRGIKAADQLWQAHKIGNIEGLSVKAIKAGQNGLRKRMENLSPGDAEDAKTMRAYQAIIDEADHVLKVFKTDAANTIQILREGGKVSEESMRKTRDALKELRDAEKEGTADYIELNRQFDFMEANLKAVAEARRREKGELVDANDARREALKLTKDGAEAAQREREMADMLINTYEKEIDDLSQLRHLQQEQIEGTETLIDRNHRLQDEEQRKMDDLEKTLKKTEEADRKSAETYRDQAEAAKEQADLMEANARNEETNAQKHHQHAEQVKGDIDAINAKLTELNNQPVKPKVDTSEIERLTAEVKEAQRVLGNASAFEKLAQAKLEGMRSAHSTQETTFRSKEAELRKFTDATYELQERRNELDWAIEPFSRRHRQGQNHFDVHDIEHQRVALEKLDEAFRRLSDDDYFKKAPLSRQYELLGTAAFGYSDAERQFGSYERAIRSLGVALEETGAKARLIFQGAGVDKSFQGVEFLEGYVSRRKEITQLNSEIKKAMGDTDIDALAREVEIERKIFIESTEEIKEQEREVERWGKLKEEYAGKAAEAERNLEEAERALNEEKSKSVKVTQADAEAIKKEDEELEKLLSRLDRLQQNLGNFESEVNGSIKELHQLGLTEGDLADDVKVREAVEKKVLEIMEAQAKVGQEIAERRRQLTGEIKMSQLGGTKADQEFYAKNKDRYELSDYATPDDMIERIAHLERLSKIKNGKRFNPDEDWEDDELDEDAPVMNDKEKQGINEELRVLKQHIREELLKTIKEVGDINKAVEQYTGGDGVSEEAKFGEQLNDKIDAIKEKIEENIVTTLDKYGEMLTEDRDEDAKLTKEQLTERVGHYVGAIKEHIGFNRDWMEETQGDIETTKEQIDAKQQLIQSMKQGTQAQKESTEATEQSTDIDKQKEELLEQKRQKEDEYSTALNNETQAQQSADKARQEANAKLSESMKLEQKAADMEDTVAHAAENHAKAMDKAGEEARKLQAEEQELEKTLEGQEQILHNIDDAIADNEVKRGEAESKKAQAQDLTIKRMEEMLALLRKENNEDIPANTDKWRENEAEIEKLDKTIRELKGEWMSYAEAEEFASKAGGDGFIATAEQMQKATQAMERQRDSLIKTIQLKQKNGEATDEEEKKLKDLEEQLKRLKFENDNFNMTHKRMKELLDEPTRASDLDELRAAIKRADGELRHMQQSLGENSKQYQEFAEKVKNSKNVLKEMEGQAKANATAWDKAWSRLKTYVGMYMGFNMAWQRMTGTADDLMQLSDKLGEVRKTTGFTADEVGRLSDSLKKMDTRTSITGLLDLSVAAGQLGLKSQQDVEGFTEAANKLMVALPEMGQEGATQMLKIALATGEISKIQRDMDAGLIDGSSATAVAMEKVGSTIDRLRASSAATAPAITDFVKRVGAVGAQSGISIDQVAALGSTVDALGMRVEMSATALSRMIPAIKNNAFAVAKAIGMVPEDLRAMFDEAGGGMNAMIAIFEHIKKQGMGADDIEKLLGMGGMQEIMKELNQQGARAGIVFAGLSQNVETLKAHLLTAAEAYKENTAIQQEYNKMNETTAAKWARLKNQLEEAFVSDSMQRGVGKLIDGLRIIIDLLTGDGGLSTFARGALVYLALFKSKWSEAIGNAILSLGKFIWSMRESAIAAEADAAAKAADATATEALGDATEDTTEKTNIFTKTWGKMNAALKANIIGAAVTTIVWLVSSLWDAHKAAKEAAEAINRVNEKTEEEREAVDSLFAPLKKANLEEAEKKRLITEINSKYGSYLNNMLTEASNAYEIERAYKAINLQLERKNTLEGIETNKKTVMERHKDALDTAYSEMDTAVGKAFYGKKGTDAARVSSLVSTAVRDAIKNGLSADQMSRQIQTALRKEVSAGRMKEYIQIMTGGTSRREDASKYIANAAIRYFNAEQAAQNEVKSTNKRLQNHLDYTIQEIRKAATKDIPELLKTFNNAMSKGTDAKKYSAKESNAVVQAFNAIKGYYDLHQADLTDAQRKRLSKALGTDITTFQSRAEGGGNNNGWGSNHEAASTDWRSMTAEELVARRKQMKDFVNAIQDDSDVERVLKEDAALQKAIAGGLNKNFRSVVEWYNTERLKIQDELYNRHLTNTGDWRDPKKGGGSWRRQLQTDFDNYLRILDAYYTERKAEIEKAQSEEGMSEAEAQRLIIENEIVWRKHRMELQQIYQGKSEQIAKEERQRIYDILAQQDEDTADMVEKTIGKSLGKMKILATKSEVDFNRVMSRITKSIATDFYKQQHAVSNQVEAIEKIIAQERPFDGLVENLEKNLSTMGILFAELDKKRREVIAAGNEPEDDTHLRGEDATRKRMLVLMQQAESAYTLTFGKLKEVMIKEGFADWAETIENDDQLRKAMMAMLRKMYDDVHAAIKKESTQMKKELDIWWNDIEGEGKLSRKGGFEKMLSDLGLAEDQVKRANSLIGAGQASERVADKLAIQQMRVRLAMQNAYYAKLKEIGELRIKQLQNDEADLRKKGKVEEADLKLLDIKHTKQALNLSLSEEQTKVLEQEVAIQNQIEESQNRLYTELKAWGDLLASSMKEIFEATHAGDAEYYNERAKLNLTGKGGPGAGTYIIIDNEGTSDATAHYEYLDEREALERQHEIERQNAQAEAWRKVMDDINAKMNEQITDWMNAYLQNASIDMNTTAVDANTVAVSGLTEQLSQGIKLNTEGAGGATDTGTEFANDKQANYPGFTEQPETQPTSFESTGDFAGDKMMYYQQVSEAAQMAAQAEIDASNQVRDTIISNTQQQTQVSLQNDKKIQAGTQSAFAKMTAAANLYGIAYQAMSNDNLSTTQKFEMIAVQAAGQAAISALTASLAQNTGQVAADTPAVASKTFAQLGPIAGPTAFAAITALLGGLLGFAVSKIAKSKSQIAQVTGASASVGRLTTGMQTYAEGNVNEFSDPASLTPGRSYNVDAADGRTYRAKYTGANPSTHLTNGPEFHLAGEKGREMIIDAGTTRQITMNENEIWQAIKTLSGGGRITSSRRRGRGVHAFAEGNVEDFDTAITDNQTTDMGFDAATMQASLDRNSEVMEYIAEHGIKAIVSPYGPDGLVAGYDKYKKEALRHGEKHP